VLVIWDLVKDERGGRAFRPAPFFIHGSDQMYVTPIRDLRDLIEQTNSLEAEFQQRRKHYLSPTMTQRMAQEAEELHRFLGSAELQLLVDKALREIRRLETKHGGVCEVHRKYLGQVRTATRKAWALLEEVGMSELVFA
jgi:ribosomal protein S21